MKEKLEEKPNINSLINYSCNRFIPPILITILLFVSMGFSNWIPWAVCGLVLFIDRNVFKVGYAVGYVDKAEGNSPNI
jgi:hypothetical protein|tara:strand:+ start:5335 stop:5568 length:234 start_codon:yes stop_codon:yes gene_type:complete